MAKFHESIVLVGGGGGVYRVARFLKNIRSDITTIQTVFDHGRHSGQLRDERGVLPPGDIRQAILALSDDSQEPTLRKLMSYRFSEKGESSLNNATVGNILLTALTEIEGSLPSAINALCRLCHVRGHVLPVSLDNSELCVELSDGAILKGEDKIDNRSIEDSRTIKRVFLEPQAHVFVGAYEALLRADKIILCPGDLYTSLLPNLLVDGFADALSGSKAKLIYVVNIMTKKAETDGFNVSDFVRVVHEHISGREIDTVIYNSEEIDSTLIQKYEAEKSQPILMEGAVGGYVRNLLPRPLVDASGGIVRHHERIASIIADL
jgi:uncharacterized cofD-like protein